jgi:hypothetical protein
MATTGANVIDLDGFRRRRAEERAAREGVATAPLPVPWMATGWVPFTVWVPMWIVI